MIHHACHVIHHASYNAQLYHTSLQDRIHHNHVVLLKDVGHEAEKEMHVDLGIKHDSIGDIGENEFFILNIAAYLSVKDSKHTCDKLIERIMNRRSRSQGIGK